MQKSDLPAVARAIATLVREHVAAAVEGVSRRLASLEETIRNLPVPKDGTSITLEDARPVVAEAVREAVATLPVPKDGASVTVDEVLPAVLEAMRAAVAELPPAKDGASVTLDDVRPLIDEAVKSLPPATPGESGKSVKVEDVLPALRDQIDGFLKALPVPQDGKSPSVDEVVQALLPGIEKALDGLHARWALDFERRAQETLQRACAAIPKPKDGDNGRDALAVDQFGAKLEDDGRTVLLTLGAGESRKEARLQFPVVLDRGVFKEGGEYLRGDAVTWGGCLWIAQKDAPEGKPDSSRDWRLSVKKGRDGKDGVVRTIAQPATVKAAP